MKRIINYILITILIITYLPEISLGHIDDAENYLAWNEKIWSQANEDTEIYYEYPNYYPKENKKNDEIRMYFKQAGQESKEMSYIFAYGDPTHGRYSDTLQLHQYLGKSLDGILEVPNPPYGWEDGWNGRMLHEWGQVKEPWYAINTKTGESLCQKGKFDNEELKSPKSEFSSLEECIQAGMDEVYAGKSYWELNAKRGESIKEDKPKVYIKGMKPEGGAWLPYVHVVVLPTSQTWGQGLMYLKDGTYVTIPIAPFNLTTPDFKPEIFSPFASTGAYTADEVSVNVTVKSTFKNDQETTYKWMVVSEDGKRTYHDKADTECSYSGYGEGESKGSTTIPGKKSTFKATFNLKFKMPDESIKVIFTINPGNKPQDVQDNNTVVLSIVGHHYEIQEANYVLDYDELSKGLEHKLAGGSISGSMDPPGRPNGYWSDEYNMQGSLPIDIKDNMSGGRTALSGAGVKGGTNEPVDEPSNSVTRSPIIKGIIERSDFNDDPENGVYHAAGEVVNKMIIYYNKLRGNNLTRQYRYHYDHSEPNGKDSKGNTIYTTCTSCSKVYSTDTAYGRFSPGEDLIAIKALIYNGMNNMPHVAARDFLKEIENNETDELSKTILWESQEFPMVVQRWMKHVTLTEAGANEEKWVPVEGQYERIFTHQNKATITWNVDKSIASCYKQDRTNAKNRRKDKAGYKYVPFATDRELQSYDYPFKSGYYFNPAGTYSITIHTEIYKDDKGETEEHKELVNRAIESFRYGSTMQYVEKKTPIKLLLQIEDASKDDISVLSPEKLLEANKAYKYVKDFEIPSWPNESGYTHQYFKEILEGYDESDTIESKDEYKYREYIREGKIYRVVEETTVTFIVNEDNTPVYTYGGMKNGTYHNTVWVEDTNISDITKVKGMVLKGVNGDTPLDHIPITVQGSMYDDLNN